jgi:hypothetical protein
MNALEHAYDAKKKQYDDLIKSNKPSDIPRIRTLNKELSDLLHDMLNEVAKVKGTAATIDANRDALMKKLVKIQNDYSILLQQKDQYETLKILQGHEQAKFDAVFFWYAIALGIVAVLFAIMIAWKGGYKAPTIPTMTSRPTTMAPFTYM